MKPVVGITSYAEEVTWGAWVEAGCSRPALVCARDRACRRPPAGRPAERGRDRGDPCRARRDPLLGRLRPRSGALRRGGSPGDPGRARGAGPRRDGPAGGCARARHAGARRVPRLAGAERRSRRRPRPAPARGARPRGAQAHAGRVPDHEVTLEPESARRRAPGRARAGQVAPPSGLRADRRGPREAG